MKRMRKAWIAALACTLACGNGSDSTAGSAQGQSHWLESCEREADCGGLACICGVCIAPCDAHGECTVEGRTTVCQSPDAGGARALCGESPPAPICLESCNDGCPDDQRCAGGVCVPGERPQPSGQDGGGGVPPADGGGLPPADGGGVPPSDGGGGDPGRDGGGGVIADSGAGDASTGPDQDAAVPPLDCMAFPAFDRSCSDVSECASGARQVDCCGSQITTGLHVDALASFQAAAATCASQFPLCGCASSPTRADDGSMVAAGAGTQPTVECVDGTCRTTFLRGPTACGPNLNCDAATEICVSREPVGPSVQWSCEPVPAGCEQQRNCECAATTLCDGTFDQCTDSGSLNAIDCHCLSCQ